MSIAIVGGGVIGLTVAYTLQQAGHKVTVITKDDILDTVSAVSGAAWTPRSYAEPLNKIIFWAERTLLQMRLLSQNPEAGIQLVKAENFYSSNKDFGPDLALTNPTISSVLLGQGPWNTIWHTVGYDMPCADMPVYLAWLKQQCLTFGVQILNKEIKDVNEAHNYGDLVILATGLGTSSLVHNAEMYPIQGQVVRVENPGGIGYWHYDDEEQTTYIIPRLKEVVIGGTHVKYTWDTTIDEKLEQQMLENAYRLEPRLQGMPVTSRITGLRPGRDEIRLELVDNVIHAYGHGGVGVTVSWGYAEDVVSLVQQWKRNKEL
jgi:D-amino-acid oxidase